MSHSPRWHWQVKGTLNGIAAPDFRALDRPRFQGSLRISRAADHAYAGNQRGIYNAQGANLPFGQAIENQPKGRATSSLPDQLEDIVALCRFWNLGPYVQAVVARDSNFRRGRLAGQTPGPLGGRLSIGLRL